MRMSHGVFPPVVCDLEAGETLADLSHTPWSIGAAE